MFKNLEPECLKRSYITRIISQLDEGYDINVQDEHGATLLHRVVWENEESAVHWLLEKGAATNVRDNLGRSPLFLSVLKKNEVIFKKLLEKGADVTIADSRGISPLNKVVLQKDVDLVKEIINKGLELGYTDEENRSFLHYVVIEQFEAAVDLLLRKEVDLEVKDCYNQTPLHLAVIEEHINIVTKLLEYGAKINCIDNRNTTPLHYAQNVSMAGLLLDMGADTEIEDYNGQTPFFAAVFLNNYNLVKFFIERGSLVNVKDNNGNTPLNVAQNLETVQLLLDSGIAANIKNNFGQTPLHNIMLWGFVQVYVYKDWRNRQIVSIDVLEISTLLLQRGADVNATDNNGFSPLHIALYYSLDLELIKLLLREGADIDQKDKNGRTPLVVGISNCSLRGVHALLREEGNVNCKDEEAYPLHFALSNLDMESVREVISTGHEIKFENEKCQTPLHIAVMKNFKLGVEYLLEKGYQVNLRDKTMKTPLHYAVLINSEEVVTMLINKGADLDVKDSVGFTPLHYAVLVGNLKLIEFLLDKNANLNSKDINGQSPLHIAVLHDSLHVIKILLQKRADINEGDNDGNTPLHFAVMLRTVNLDLVRELLYRGAEVDIQNANGQTPLHIAVEKTIEEFLRVKEDIWHDFEKDEVLVISMLFDNGASLDIADNKNRTPLLLHLTSGVPKEIYVWKKQAIKLKCANLITHDIEKEIDSVLSLLDVDEDDLYSYDHESLKELCEKELEKMRKVKFGSHSLHSVFSNYRDPIFVKINAIEDIIMSHSLHAEYPLYDSLLKVTFKRAKHRHILLDDTELNFPVKSENLVRIAQLPNETKRKILSHLSDNDLLNIQKANEDIWNYSSVGENTQLWTTPKYLLPPSNMLCYEGCFP